jgi:hypothetical protein
MLNSFGSMNVHLAIPDLLWPHREPPSGTASGRLVALEQLFARGRRAHVSATNLEQWLIGAWHAAGGAAAYALLADGGEPGDGIWVRADPCHLRVDRAELTLVDTSLFDLSREDAEALVESLNRHFAHRGLAFCPMLPERWYVRVDALEPIESPPLAAVRGKPVEAQERVASWHALTNEIQMLLHEHPVNQAREGRGELTVNSIWFSGGGRLIAPAAKPFRRVRANNPLAAGLARASATAMLPLPGSGGEWLRASASEGVELIVLDSLSAPLSYGDQATWRDRVAALDRDWLAPLLDALRAGRIGMLTLHAIGSDRTIDVEATRQDLRYFWRRAKPLSTYAAQ